MRINCVNPLHADETPSMHVYEKFAYCFSCGYRVLSEQVVSGEDLETLKKEPEDVEATINYIRQCPIRTVRGLEFYTDSTGYFILWSTLDFYKRRLFKGDTRYIGPRGRRAPLFKIPGKSKTDCIVIEGEINALSLATAINEDYPILSPGSANELLRHINEYLTFKHITVIIDKDIPGVISGLKLKAELLKAGKKVVLIAVEKDLNDVLQEEGREGIQKWIKENLEMP